MNSAKSLMLLGLIARSVPVITRLVNDQSLARASNTIGKSWAMIELSDVHRLVSGQPVDGISDAQHVAMISSLFAESIAHLPNAPIIYSLNNDPNNISSYFYVQDIALPSDTEKSGNQPPTLIGAFNMGVESIGANLRSGIENMLAFFRGQAGSGEPRTIFLGRSLEEESQAMLLDHDDIEFIKVDDDMAYKLELQIDTVAEEPEANISLNNVDTNHNNITQVLTALDSESEIAVVGSDNLPELKVDIGIANISSLEPNMLEQTASPALPILDKAIVPANAISEAADSIQTVDVSVEGSPTKGKDVEMEPNSESYAYPPGLPTISQIDEIATQTKSTHRKVIDYDPAPSSELNHMGNNELSASSLIDQVTEKVLDRVRIEQMINDQQSVPATPKNLFTASPVTQFIHSQEANMGRTPKPDVRTNPMDPVAMLDTIKSLITNNYNDVSIRTANNSIPFIDQGAESVSSQWNPYTLPSPVYVTPKNNTSTVPIAPAYPNSILAELSHNFDELVQKAIVARDALSAIPIVGDHSTAPVHPVNMLPTIYPSPTDFPYRQPPDSPPPRAIFSSKLGTSTNNFASDVRVQEPAISLVSNNINKSLEIFQDALRKYRLNTFIIEGAVVYLSQLSRASISTLMDFLETEGSNDSNYWKFIGRYNIIDELKPGILLATRLGDYFNKPQTMSV